MSTLTMAPPRFVYFDLGNVILKFDHQIACRQIAQLSGVAEETVNQIVFQSDLQTRYESGRIDTAEFYEQFCAETGSRPPLDEFVRAGSDIFSLNVTVMPVIVQLFRSGVRLGVLSNTCPAHWDFICRHRYTALESLFDVYALSYQLQSMKPEAAIYERAVELAGLPKEELLFIDDRPENVAGARACGIDSIHFTAAPELARQLRLRGLRFNY